MQGLSLSLRIVTISLLQKKEGHPCPANTTSLWHSTNGRRGEHGSLHLCWRICHRLLAHIGQGIEQTEDLVQIGGKYVQLHVCLIQYYSDLRQFRVFRRSAPHPCENRIDTVHHLHLIVILPDDRRVMLAKGVGNGDRLLPRFALTLRRLLKT